MKLFLGYIIFVCCVQVVFEAVRGPSYTSDVAIDDVSIISGACPAPGSCNFESGKCGYSNIVNGDDFDWSRTKGRSPSAYTGPHTDHTTNSENGLYP